MTVDLIVILALIVIAVIYVIATFNSLIRLQNRADGALSHLSAVVSAPVVCAGSPIQKYKIGCRCGNGCLGSSLNCTTDVSR